MASKKETALKTASVLAFERKLDPSDALFYSGQWNERANSSAWAPVTLREKSVRGTISNRMKGGSVDDAKLDAQIEKPNLQTVDVASLPPGCRHAAGALQPARAGRRGHAQQLQ
jgi:CRISPR-associated protein Csy3